jgi:MacB-like periplasmic core domain
VNNYPPLVYAAGSRANIFRDETEDLRPSNAAVRPYRYDVSPEYFHAAGTALLAGRDLTWHDDKNAPPVIVVNREFADKIFGSVTNAVGRYLKMQDGTRVQVVGVVEDPLPATPQLEWSRSGSPAPASSPVQPAPQIPATDHSSAAAHPSRTQFSLPPESPAHNCSWRWVRFPRASAEPQAQGSSHRSRHLPPSDTPAAPATRRAPS